MSANVYRTLRIVEFVSTDAASSELLGVKMLQRGVQLDGNDALCPHLRMHTRGNVHATQRILNRPFDSDPFLKGIVDRFVMANTTLLSTSQSSGYLSDQFKRSCKRRRLPHTPVVLATHRCSCLRKGLPAHVRHMMPLLGTARICWPRGTDRSWPLPWPTARKPLRRVCRCGADDRPLSP